MNNLSQQKTLNQLSKSLSVFVIHQFIATWGIAISANILGTSIYGLFSRFVSLRSVHWILTETPFFPVQIALGLFYGWMLWRRFKHHSMLWVWVIPTIILCYAVVAFPTLVPHMTSVLNQTGSPFSHYFGWGCQPKDRCFDQLLVTMPFYTATAYSLGAMLAFTLEAPHP
jgi:hypothetical protein